MYMYIIMRYQFLQNNNSHLFIIGLSTLNNSINKLLKNGILNLISIRFVPKLCISFGCTLARRSANVGVMGVDVCCRLV